jgi:hypothetical protein
LIYQVIFYLLRMLLAYRGLAILFFLDAVSVVIPKICQRDTINITD